MAKISKTVVDKALRDNVLDELFGNIILGNEDGWNKINDRQMGIIKVDMNGNYRYVRVGVIVAEEREDITAMELMASEIEEYQMKQNAKAEKAKAKEVKIAKDKARREKEREAKENDVQ